jgi:hypothetical protein
VQPGVSICDVLTGRQTQYVPCGTVVSATDGREINFLAFGFLHELSWLSGDSKSYLNAWFTSPTMRGADISAHQSPQCDDARVALRTTETNSAQSNCREKVLTCAPGSLHFFRCVDRLLKSVKSKISISLATNSISLCPSLLRHSR